MKILVAEKLSEHRYKTPEGYLICVDSILARTGKQTYKRSEIFGDDDERLVEVDRKAEEVFSPETMASFENKPICVEHPDVDVNSGNISEFAVGFVRDIHKGEYEGEPVMLGTLVITDAKTIEEIEEGKHTDLSCGYDCDIDDSENPQQRNIRGNHVALCEQGRAGIARIMDSVKDEESTYTEVTKNLEKEAKKDMSWLDAVVKDSNDFVNSHEHRRLIYEFMENNGNSFIISKEKNRLLKYIEKETGIKNADWHDVMYIIKNHTRAKLFDEEEVKDVEQLRDSVKDFVNDGKRLPTKVKNEIQKFLNHKSTFIKNRDYDVSEFVREFERITKLWIEFPLKITRESIKGWNKTGDGMMRKDYVFSIDGYDDRFVVSLYAEPDTYETTELNAYFMDSMKNIEDNMKKYAKDKHGKTFTLEEIEGGKVKATNMSGREKIFSGWKEAEKEFGKRGIAILDSFYDIVEDSVKDAKYVIMHPRKNLYLTVGAKTWSDESGPMIKKFDSVKEAEEYAKKNTSDFRIAVFDSVKDAKIEYIFNYHDTYHGTRDKMRVNANNLDEAIREFGKTMALGGFGTANIYVVSVSPNDGYMRAYGKLSEMLKQKWTREHPEL